MSRGKSISVKIATPKVIKALETRLAELEKNYATQGENEARYAKSVEKWRKEVGKWAIENFSKAENLRTNYRSIFHIKSSEIKLSVAFEDRFLIFLK